ncbi:MAG: carbon storage regulator [Pirellulales bacterium]|nr:carbon storage regulator [Pirellulales bacterium]
MLVLSRKEGEKIVLDEDITVEVIHITGHRVRLGIEAPRLKRIMRKELLEQILKPDSSCNSSNGPLHRRRQISIDDGGRVNVDANKQTRKRRKSTHC